MEVGPAAVGERERLERGEARRGPPAPVPHRDLPLRPEVVLLKRRLVQNLRETRFVSASAKVDQWFGLKVESPSLPCRAWSGFEHLKHLTWSSRNLSFESVCGDSYSVSSKWVDQVQRFSHGDRARVRAWYSHRISNWHTFVPNCDQRNRNIGLKCRSTIEST